MSGPLVGAAGTQIIGGRTANIQLSGLEAAKVALENLGNEMPAAAVRALNETLKNVKTDIKKLIREDYNYKVATIDSRIKLEKAHRQRMTGWIESRGIAPNLTDITNTSSTQKGVKVNVKKSTGRKLLPRTFIQSVGSGKKIVLRRPGNPRGQHETLYARYGPKGSGGKAGSRARLDWFVAAHPEVIYNTPQNWAKIEKAASERLMNNIEREIAAELRKAEGKWNNS